MLNKEVQQYWDDLVRRDEADWRLAEAALMFAKQIYPKLEPRTYLVQLDELASRVAQQAGGRHRAGLLGGVVPRPSRRKRGLREERICARRCFT